MAKIYYSKTNKTISPTILNKIYRLFEKLEMYYPEKIIVYLKRDHNDLAKRTKELRISAGYQTNEEFCEDFGFQYVDINQLYKYSNQEQIQIIADKINLNKKKEFNNISDKIDYENFKLQPLENYYYNNKWHNIDKTKKIDSLTQQKINIVMNKILSWYPKRIVYKFYTTNRKYVEDRVLPLRKQLGYQNYKEFLESYGFIYYEENIVDNFSVYSDQFKDLQADELNKYYYDGTWHTRSTIEISTDLINDINYIFDILYGLYPDRKINNLTYAQTIGDFDILQKSVMRKLNYHSLSDFLTDFGFLYNKYFPDCTLNLPDTIYSPDRKILYKVLNDVKKIPINENTELIKKGCFDNANIKVIDLSLLPDYSLVIEEGAFNDCQSLEYILNPQAIKKSFKDSFTNCPELKYDLIYDEIYKEMSIEHFLFEIELLCKDKKEYIISDKFYNPGTYLKKYLTSDIYLINRIRPTSIEYKIEYETNVNYVEYKDLKIDKLIIDIDDFTLFTQNNTDYNNHIFQAYSAYLSDHLDHYCLNSEVNTELYDIDELNIPLFDNDQFQMYDKKPLSEIVKTMYYVLIESNTYNFTKNFKTAILGLNSYKPFLYYKYFIYNDTYIKTFLKIQNKDATIFMNSNELMYDKKFILKIFELFPYTDTNMILPIHFNDKKFVKKVLSFVKNDKNKETLLSRLEEIIVC